MDLYEDILPNRPVLKSTDLVNAGIASASTLVRWRKCGFGPPFAQPTGGHAMYRRKDVIEWFHSKKDHHRCKEETKKDENV